MNKSAGFFVAGTDTEVGKTLVSGALIVKLREQQINAIGFKPVVAGTYKDKSGITLNEDLETLRIASDLSHGELSLCPYVLDKPAAPHLVAAQQGLKLEMSVMHNAFQNIQKHADCIVVEGAGGLLVPLNQDEDLGGFAKKIDLPIIFVVGMKLGCLNHALLTYEVIKARNLKIAGWIANALEEEMPLLQGNLQTLRARIDAPFLGLIPSLPKELQKTTDSPYSIEALHFAAKHIQLPNQ
ncbi:ATP-dependent dethiobiotin synthetase BioD [Polynucleobacter yangtzensis]|uniref:ATP-dependent dethiobiotin synthetase BioD n=1 Tax=Polynucleobacter yangtzensis TaxID=1743159 RepID=A0A9C7C8V1_9BURK|nr:dethiobiotin synthase [Polynucleobacter yangtzensis]BDT76356.1 ATP-dependent dethiobiotin synthetase BioD [Polynucleobacter yangtzensis]